MLIPSLMTNPRRAFPINEVYPKSTDRPRGPAVPISKKAEQIKIKVMPFFVPDLEALPFSAFQMVNRETFPRGPSRGVQVESRLEIPTRPTELLPLQCKTRTKQNLRTRS